MKNDATDAEAICEAVPRPSTRFVETKTTGLSAGDFLQKTRPPVELRQAR
jgi:transposase